MIDVKDLQIGDWVMTEAGMMRVAQIFKNHIDCDVPTGSKTWDVTTIEPIPITAKILEKNGFEEVGDGIVQFFERPFYVWFSAQYELGIEREETSFLEEIGTKRVLNMPCIYVHELQHLLRLCEIDKTIEL